MILWGNALRKRRLHVFTGNYAINVNPQLTKNLYVSCVEYSSSIIFYKCDLITFKRDKKIMWSMRSLKWFKLYYDKGHPGSLSVMPITCLFKDNIDAIWRTTRKIRMMDTTNVNNLVSTCMIYSNRTKIKSQRYLYCLVKCFYSEDEGISE